MKPQFIPAYLVVPGVCDALQRVRDQRDDEAKRQVLIVQDVESEGEVEVAWSVEITQDGEEADAAEGGEGEVKEGVVLKDSWPSDIYYCYGDCYPDIGTNATASIFYAKDNCKFRGHCSNSIQESPHLELSQSETGIGVRVTATFLIGATLALYTGLLTDYDFDKDKVQRKCVVSLQSRGKRNTKLYANAQAWGTYARITNYNCNPNTEFELCHNREVHVIVKVIKKIAPGSEITVDYGSTWFKHR
ncbi:unnamed protein product [Phytophthora fragariaefolia]|uniref:Unnamed protein product n=1 Tax=Phytophthora fragariaefolia TaxID=1490495 RepID=A0A9W7DBR4_9STRA|nr:unnamed protein product [Phytophthora fragariaefolia]